MKAGTEEGRQAEETIEDLLFADVERRSVAHGCTLSRRARRQSVQIRQFRTDIEDVIEAIWTFQRNDERLSIRRCGQDATPTLAVTIGDRPRTFGFPSIEDLDRFQQDMETFLLRTGWGLAGFLPERRTLGDRRTFPREQNDRRRWWTDPHPAPPRTTSLRLADR